MQTSVAPTVFAVIPLTPFPILWSVHCTGKGGGKKWLFAPCWGLSSTLNQALLFLHLKISYSFFNFQLNWCLWTFSSFPSGSCSLFRALMACLHASIAAIVTQCGNDLLQLWAPGFVLPMFIIATLIQRGHTWGVKPIPYHSARASLRKWALAIPLLREGDFLSFVPFLIFKFFLLDRLFFLASL